MLNCAGGFRKRLTNVRVVGNGARSRVKAHLQLLHDALGVLVLERGVTTFEVGDKNHMPVRGTKVCAIPGRPCKRADESVGSRDIGCSALSSLTMRQHGSAAIPESVEHSLDVAPRDPAWALVPNLIHLRVLCFISLLIRKVGHGAPVSLLQTRARNVLP